MPSKDLIPVYLEAGKRRVFAGAIDWPGWCRSGRDEKAALETLLLYGPRYARVLQTVDQTIALPATLSGMVVAERLEGNATTDFGAPAAVPVPDERGISDEDLDRLSVILQACWLAFDRAARAAAGKTLRKGPRGGGRDAPGIVQHTLEANRVYLGKLAWKPAIDSEASPEVQMDQMLEEVLQALAGAAAGNLPSRGPRGRKLWPPSYFVRRAAWHMLDHAWEIEDRTV